MGSEVIQIKEIKDKESLNTVDIALQSGDSSDKDHCSNKLYPGDSETAKKIIKVLEESKLSIYAATDILDFCKHAILFSPARLD